MKNFNKILITGLILLMPLQAHAFGETYYIDRDRTLSYKNLEGFIDALKKHDKHKDIKYKQVRNSEEFDVTWKEEFKLEIPKG